MKEKAVEVKVIITNSRRANETYAGQYKLRGFSTTEKTHFSLCESLIRLKFPMYKTVLMKPIADVEEHLASAKEDIANAWHS